MRIIKGFFILLIALTLSYQSFSQEIESAFENTKKKTLNNEEKFRPYLFTGGFFWAGFGTFTFVDVNLVFGSQITERIKLGVSGKYQYLKDKRSINGNFETNIFGGSVFSQIGIINDFRNLFKTKTHSGILAHVEYEFLNTEYNYIYFNDKDTGRDRFWLHNLLVGGGYFQYMGKKSTTYIIVLWNLTTSSENQYTYPQLKIGFTLGI